MEIARMGIFNPQYFSVENVMIIFLAVMITDILLLDAFNTIGFPTSTTVSIIFELLGASIVVAGYKVLQGDFPMSYLFNIDDVGNGIIGYLNWSKTSEMVFSILISVVLAFITGAFVMWISRILFSFNYQRRLRYIGVIWSSIAMLALSYFLVYKGFKSTYSTNQLTAKEILAYNQSFDPNVKTLPNSDTYEIVDPQGVSLKFTKIEETTSDAGARYEIFFGSKDFEKIIHFIQDNFLTFLALVFIFWIIAFSIFERSGGNPLKIVVFAGLFSIAMAFAGNDLVNFIGVPLAGWQSYDLYLSAKSVVGSSLTPTNYMMNGLRFPTQAPYIYLLISGIIMTLTLWLSKKSKTVIETEIKLATQEESREKFKSNAVSRAIVRGSIKVSDKLNALLPSSFKLVVNKQFEPLVLTDDADQPAFDLVRASVNMTMASMLIAMGTSLKLPLSTTYVTFMVAMGSSLADQAWGRESAAYRIAGVFNVISGWFITAFVAFTASAIVALILISFKFIGLILLCVVAALFFFSTNFIHRQKVIKSKKYEEALNAIDLSTERAFTKTSSKLASSIESIKHAYSNVIFGLLEEDRTKIAEAYKSTEELNSFYSDIKNNLFKAIKKSKLNEKQTAQLYILSNDMMQDILQSLTLIVNSADTHLKNAHKPITEVQASNLKKIHTDVIKYLEQISIYLNNNDYTEAGQVVKFNKRSIFDQIELTLSKQVEGIYMKVYGFKNTDLMMSLLLETKDMVAIAGRFAKLMKRILNGESPLGNRDV
jgi:phosphate/sulfate permease